MFPDHLETLFGELRDCEDAEREARLAELRRDDPARCAELESLLAAAARAGAFLDTPPTPPGDGDLAGQRVGVYRLIRELGRGGMGAVYLAERDDGQYRQQVAVKLIRPDLNAPDLVERFRAERQILADLRHPHIATLLDGGSREDGRLYLVLEYVAGEPIDVHCRSRSLSLEQRLALFTRVCEAVQHAHEQGVIHRDLKPANILVTAGGEPRLLDFGVARLLSPDPGQSLTGDNPAPMTPAYAAPEQLRGTMVTPATDVYALGLILFELLTGKPPHASPLARLEPAAGAPRPSHAVAPSLRRRLRGDLDSIVARALDPEPTARYATVAALLEDLDRQRRQLPVRARGDGPVYRLGKFLGRHRLHGGLVALAGLVLLGGSMIPAAWFHAGLSTGDDCGAVLAGYRQHASGAALIQLSYCRLQQARRLNDAGQHARALAVLAGLRERYRDHPGRPTRLAPAWRGQLLAEQQRASQGMLALR